MSGPPTEEQMRAGFHAEAQRVEKAKRDGAEPAAGKSPPSATNKLTTKQVRSLVDRIVRLEEEKAGLANDIKELLEEGKSDGHSKKALRIVVKRELEDAEQRASREAVEDEAEALIAALGEFASSPLGAAAVSRGKH